MQYTVCILEKYISLFFSEAFWEVMQPEPLIAILGATSSLSRANKYEKNVCFDWNVDCKRVNSVCVWKTEAVPTMSNTLALERQRFW